MKVAIVTGVAGGIGKASALALAKKGYAIVGMGRSARPDLSDFAGLDITYIPGDISSAEDRARLFDAAVANHKGAEVELQPIRQEQDGDQETFRNHSRQKLTGIIGVTGVQRLCRQQERDKGHNEVQTGEIHALRTKETGPLF